MSRFRSIAWCIVAWLLLFLVPAATTAGGPARDTRPSGLPDPEALVWQYGDGLTQPPPILSTFQDCLGRSPRNLLVEPVFQYTYAGTLRTESGPVQNYPAANVELHIMSPCPNPVILNPDGPSGPDGVIVWGAAKLNQGGGACAGVGVTEIRVADLLFFTLDDVRSPDEDGDGVVGLNDLVIWQQSFVSQTPRYLGDLDCNDIIALGDLLVWQRHYAGS